MLNQKKVPFSTMIPQTESARRGYSPIKDVDYKDGKDGKNGDRGPMGNDGYTPIKGVDYFDGERGLQGPQGEQGIQGIQGIQGTAGTSGGTPVYTLLSSGILAMDFSNNTCVKITPSATQTFTTTVPPAGSMRTLMILTSGTVTRTVTFGTGFKPTTTLATGTVSARVFVIHWISDGVNLYESGRTAAMVA
jgi:hypothetical protein